jgi:hypothetical protein
MLELLFTFQKTLTVGIYAMTQSMKGIQETGVAHNGFTLLFRTNTRYYFTLEIQMELYLLLVVSTG